MARKSNGTSDASGGSAAASSGDPAIERLGYEEAVKELEALVEAIEQGDVTLEASLQAYRRGEQLVRHCRRLLDAAETTVRESSVGDLEQGG